MKWLDSIFHFKIFVVEIIREHFKLAHTQKKEFYYNNIYFLISQTPEAGKYYN